jgi:hypothetical protein
MSTYLFGNPFDPQNSFSYENGRCESFSKYCWAPAVQISKNLAKANLSYGQNGECLSAVFPEWQQTDLILLTIFF